MMGMRTEPPRQMTIEQKKAYHRRLKRRRKRRRQAAAMGVMLLMLIAVLIGLIVLTKKDKLRGTWELDQVTVYKFDGKGHGELQLPQQGYAFDYSIDGKHLYIDFYDPAAEDTSYTYEASKDTLLLTNDNGQEYQFMRRR